MDPGSVNNGTNGTEPGQVALSYILSGGTEIQGVITTPFGDGLANATVQLSGTTTTGQQVNQTTMTGSDGSYSFSPDPGTYSVTPLPADVAAGDEFTPTRCDSGTPGTTTASLSDGSATVGSCLNISLAQDQDWFENFTGGFTLTGTVTGLDGKGIQGVTVAIQDSEQGLVQKTTATTNAAGQIVSSSSATSPGVQLAPGSVVVSVQSSDGTAFYPVPSTGSDPDCVPSGVSCDVNLNHDRTTNFSACVVPDPDGAPLPEPFADSSDPIPGAVTVAPLEAVGCWQPQNGGGGADPTIYTTDQPIRLDGIDVDPASGTTFTLNTQTLTVESSGDAQLLVDGLAVTFEHQIRLTYSGGSNPAGGNQVSVNDLGSGTGPFAPNILGLPISIGTGGPTGFGLPFIETTGQTVINAGIQVPFNSRAMWNTLDGVFEDADGDTAASLGVQGAITITNRKGLTLSGCLSLNDYKPFEFSDLEISGVTLCFDPTQKLWTGSGMFELPEWAHVGARDAYLTIAYQNAFSATTHMLDGYQVKSFQLAFDHLNTRTFDGGGDEEVEVSGIPLGAGFFLQSLGAGWTNDLEHGTLASADGTFGISFGPEVEAEGPLGSLAKLSLLRIDGTGVVSPPQAAGDPWVYTGAGALTVARLSPFERQLATGSVTYHASATAPEGDITLDAGVSLPLPGVLGGPISARMHIAGLSDVPHGILLDGTARVANSKAGGTLELLLDNSILADCLTFSNGYQTGFQYDFSHGGLPTPGCGLGKLHRPGGATAAAASAGSRTQRLKLARKLPGTELAIRGAHSVPSVRLSGPGEHLTARASRRPSFTRRMIVSSDRSTRTLYVQLLAPAAGRWRITALTGSSPIASVLEADPLPRPRVRRVSVSRGPGCTDRIRYRVASFAGDRILLVAQEGSRHAVIGTLTHRAGRLTVPMFAGIRSRGHVIAYFIRGGAPVGATTVARFADAAGRSAKLSRCSDAARRTLRVSDWRSRASRRGRSKRPTAGRFGPPRPS